MSSIVSYAEKNFFLGATNIDKRWGRLEGILKNDYTSLLYFITQLAILFGCTYQLPENFVISTILTIVIPIIIIDGKEWPKDSNY